MNEGEGLLRQFGSHQFVESEGAVSRETCHAQPGFRGRAFDGVPITVRQLVFDVVLQHTARDQAFQFLTLLDEGGPPTIQLLDRRTG